MNLAQEIRSLEQWLDAEGYEVQRQAWQAEYRNQMHNFVASTKASRAAHAELQKRIDKEVGLSDKEQAHLDEQRQAREAAEIKRWQQMRAELAARRRA
ncbi:MAG: hypothetical protein M3082_06470 [Candidatus Dormibacteraeota bacterium]|nr:hypothetical protein [Candidatus Dormibacteraeota bacterium]